MMMCVMVKDLRFEIDDLVDEDDVMILFCFIGVVLNGFIVVELEESYGVDFNAMNFDFFRVVNFLGDGLCFVLMMVLYKLMKFGVL